MDSLNRSPRGNRQFSPSDVLPFVAVPSGEKAVELQDLDIRVTVSGLLAETTQTLRFFNPNGRDLEGNLTFPLPDGAVVCGYALDVDGVLVDGVVVPKQEARRILEAEERKGVDPGLMEQVQGNLYRTRIYPIPALGARTIRITYLSDLTVLGDDAAYHLPLCHAGSIDSVSLRVEVAHAPAKPVVSGGIGNLSLNRWEDRWVAEARLGGGMPAEDLQVRLPSLPEHFTSVEKDAEGKVFFCISSRLPDDDDGAEPWNPRRLAVAWDASGSRQDVDRDLSFLGDLLATWPGVVVDVRVFRHRVEEEATFDTSAVEVDTLLAWLRELPRDGGTNLSALDFSTLPHVDDEAWLLFTDGLGTVGDALPAMGTKPVAAVTSQARCSSALLDHVARRSGGVFVNLLRVPAEAARRSIGRMGETLRIAEATGCVDLHVSSGSGRLAVTGRLEGEAGRVRLAGRGAPEGFLGVNADSAVRGRLVARAWAGREAQEIALVDGEGSERVLALARTHGLVTPGTSLLVLESLEQYLEYDIEPPASLPAMVKAFRAQRAKVDKEDRANRSRRLEGVLALWKQRVAWWERDHLAEWKKKQKATKKRERADDDSRGVLLERRMMAGVGGPPLGDMCASMAAPCPPACSPPPAPPCPEPLMDMASRCCVDEMCREAPMEQAEECCEGAPCPAPSVPAPGGPGVAPRGAEAAISVKPWTPEAPYLDALREVSAGEAYRTYLGQRPQYATSPAFFFDCSDHLLERGVRDMGLRVLSNLPELGLDDAALLRMYAWRLQQAGELDGSIVVLEGVRRQRPDEPQSHRDLALALGLRWERDGGSDDLLRAMELLYEVVLQEWDRFPEIEIIALMELNRFIHLAEQAGVEVPDSIDRRLRRLLDLDIRISMSWDADLTDVDLHVFEPTGEHAYYGHNLTEIGGLVSRDIRDGYGPEEYVLRKALPGVYAIKAHYYGSAQQTVSGACTVTATVFTNYGRPEEKKQVLMLRLDRPSHEVLVGEVTIGGADPSDEEPDRDGPDRFRKLRRGMSVDEVTAAVGQPARIRGEVETVLEYRLDAGVVVLVRMGPKLLSVQRVMEGATLDLV